MFRERRPSDVAGGLFAAKTTVLDMSDPPGSTGERFDLDCPVYALVTIERPATASRGDPHSALAPNDRAG
jgi:hypothetical protein